MIVAIVQARMGNTRLPGKQLLSWGDDTLIDRVFKSIRAADIPAWVAMPDQPEDDPIEDLAVGVYDMNCYRGSTLDVLGRYVACIDAMPDPKPDAILRICADRPFVNPDILRAMIRYWEANPGLDYLAPPPDAIAFAGEIVSVKALREINSKRLPADYREHVTRAIIRRGGGWFRCETFPTTVDTLADYQALAA